MNRRPPSRWRVGGRLVLGVVALGVALAVPAAKRADAAVSALLIGDSVMHGLAQGYAAPARAELASRYSYILDSATCRRLITTSCQIGSEPTPTNAITALKVRAGQYNHALVMGVGYNDSSSGTAGIGAAVDTIIAETRKQGIGHVIWLTYREAGSDSNIARLRANNIVLRSKVSQYPDLLIADWNARSWTLPSSWFSSDGLHLGGSAALSMADLIADTLDLLGPAPPGGPEPSPAPTPPPEPPPPNRCDASLWVGQPPLTLPPGEGAAPAGGVHVLGSPVRLADTRQQPGKLGAGRVLIIPIAGAYGVPADATAAIATVTSVEPCVAGFLTVYPCGTGPPTTSVLNAGPGATVANSVVVRLGEGAICVFSSQATDVLVDLTAFVAPGGAMTAAAMPSRLVDTRPGEAQVVPVAQQRIGARQGLTIDVLGVPGIDPTIGAITINLTAVKPTGNGFLSALPGGCAGGGAAPSTSTVNVVSGRDAAASATVGVIGGQICVYNSVETDVVVDLQAVHGSSGSGVRTISPARLIDTRNVQRLAAGAVLPLGVDALGGVPDPVWGVIVNLTAVSPAANGYLTLYPCSAGERPTVSNLNVVAGVTVANRALAAIGGARTICVYTSVETDVIVDVEAWIA